MKTFITIILFLITGPAIAGVFNPVNGSVVNNDNGTITFYPDQNFTGEASFDYTITDGIATDTATAVIIVMAAPIPANKPPVAVDDEFTTTENTPIEINVDDLLENDTDPDGDLIELAAGDPVVVNPDCDADIYWYADLETGNFSQWKEYHDGWNSGDWSMTVVESPVHSGNKAGKITIDTSSQKSAVRLPVRRVNNVTEILYDELYYSVWYNIPVGIEIETYWNVWDWKSNGADGSSDPVYGIYARNDADGNYFFHSDSKISLDCLYQQQGTVATSPITFKPDTWVHLECYYKWAQGPSGRMTCYQDGVEIWDLQNIYTEFCSERNPNLPRVWKVNTYSDGLNPDEVSIYIDDAAVTNKRLGSECSIK